MPVENEIEIYFAVEIEEDDDRTNCYIKKKTSLFLLFIFVNISLPTYIQP